MTWTTTRQKARQKRLELGFAPDEPGTADQILVALETATGFACQTVSAGDARLGGAQAALNPSMRAIFQDGRRLVQVRRFDAAHEYAHLFLHHAACRCAAADLEAENFTEPAPVGADRVEAPSPRPRRESEANAYAAELLLPDALLRRLFFERGQSADEIAASIGLTPVLVLAQMTETLLLPPLSAALPSVPTPAAQAVSLDPFQRAAAEFPAGPLLLGAGPGTGKTKTLVGRCQYLVRENVPPEKILCLTFSRDAAQEMRERLEQAGVGSEAAKPWVGTFHSFGMELLRRYGARIGLAAEPRLLGTLDAATLLENNLPLLELDVLDNLYDPAIHLRGILKQISRAKDELVAPEQYEYLCRTVRERAEEAAANFAAQPGKKTKKDQDAVDKAVGQAAKAAEIARCYAVYETLMAEHGYLDFGDLIYKSVKVLETCSDVRAALQAEFPHILADEYQDVNRACARMIRLLAGDAAEGLWAVGDHRQSIYRFRGASPANVAAFKGDYPNGKRRELGVNYRSFQPIVDCFGIIARALSPPAERDAFEVWQANRGKGRSDAPAVTVATTPDDDGQADGIAGLIQELRPEHPYAEQAILCRTHAQAQALVELLSVRDIPVLYLGNLLDRPEIKDLLCLLSLFSEEPQIGLLRLGAFPEYAVPQEATLTFLERTRKANISLIAALQDPVVSEGLGEAAEQGLRRIGDHLAELQTLRNDPAALLRSYLFNQSLFLRQLTANETRPFLRLQKLLAIHQFYALALAFERRVVAPAARSGPPNRVGEFLAHLRRQSAAGESPQGIVPEGAEDLDAVRILTAHKAKGLEYPVVFVPNLGRGQFPARGRSDGLPEPPGLADAAADESDEEECLFFVALSRARNRLVLSHAAASRTDRQIPPSPLLSLLDAWLELEPQARAEWPSGRPEPGAGDDLPALMADDLPVFSASALETYERCPRQFYYERELKLPRAFLSSGYPQFHGCLGQVIRWMEDAQASGQPPTEAEVQEKLEDVWAASGPSGHLHEAKYKEGAGQMLKTVNAMLADWEPQGRPLLTATLSHCRVSVRPDALGRRKDGIPVLARRRTGKPGDDDHRDKKLALLRRAAAETFPDKACALELHYLANGKTVAVPPPPTPYKAQQEADRLTKYDRAAQGIRLRLFPARPASADECQSCAYALVCPL